jgi:hypothetical protein
MKKQDTMKIKAIAIYNEKTQQWEVKIKSKDTWFNNFDNKWRTNKMKSKVNIDYACDEFVIPMAILEQNGFNAKQIYENI